METMDEMVFCAGFLSEIDSFHHMCWHVDKSEGTKSAYRGGTYFITTTGKYFITIY